MPLPSAPTAQKRSLNGNALGAWLRGVPVSRLPAVCRGRMFSAAMPPTVERSFGLTTAGVVPDEIIRLEAVLVKRWCANDDAAIEAAELRQTAVDASCDTTSCASSRSSAPGGDRPSTDRCRCRRRSRHLKRRPRHSVRSDCVSSSSRRVDRRCAPSFAGVLPGCSVSEPAAGYQHNVTAASAASQLAPITMFWTSDDEPDKDTEEDASFSAVAVGLCVLFPLCPCLATVPSVGVDGPGAAGVWPGISRPERAGGATMGDRMAARYTGVRRRRAIDRSAGKLFVLHLLAIMFRHDNHCEFR